MHTTGPKIRTINQVEERKNPLLYLSLFVLATCFVLGGHTNNGLLSDAVLQFLSLPLIAISLVRLLREQQLKQNKLYIIFVLALFLLPLLQLVPLPVEIWSHLPMREKIIAALGAINQQSVFQPLTITSEKTWLSLLTLLPTTAIFFGALLLNTGDRWRLVSCIIVFAVINAFLGLLQLSQGPESIFYFYDYGRGETGGFFINRNHFAALIYATLPFVVAIFSLAVNRFLEENGNNSNDYSSIFSVVFSVLIIFIMIAAGIMSRSRMGVILLMLSLLISSFLPRWNSHAFGAGAGGKHGFQRIFFIVASLAMLFALQYGLLRILGRFEADPLEDARWMIARLTMEGGWRAFPVGTGIGSFVNAFFLLEKPSDLLVAYVNEAHNEYLQLLLEGGAPAIILLVIFLIWFAARLKKLWGQQTRGQDSEALILRRAASLVIVLFGLHAFVEFHLRTQALAAVFALCCAILLPASEETDEARMHDRSHSRSRRHHGKIVDEVT